MKIWMCEGPCLPRPIFFKAVSTAEVLILLLGPVKATYKEKLKATTKITELTWEKFQEIAPNEFTLRGF